MTRNEFPLQMATYLLPRIEREIGKLASPEKEALKGRALVAQAALTDYSVPCEERLTRVNRTLEEDPSFGAAWRFIVASVQDAGGECTADREIRAFSVIVGIILEKLKRGSERRAA